MHQREAARSAWVAAGLYKSGDAKLRRFLHEFDATPQDCWPQVVELVRKTYPEFIVQLVTPLWKSGDTLLRVNLIRHADLSRKNEAELVGRWAAALDAERDRYELAAVVEHGSAQRLDKVLKRKKLSDSLRLAAYLRRIEIA